MISSTTDEHPIPEELLIKYPKWLPEDICNAVQRHISSIVFYKHLPLEAELGIYDALKNRFNRIISILISQQMKEIWNNLYQENPEKTLDLIVCLLRIENDFDHALGLRFKHENEIKNTEKIARVTQSLIDVMSENYAYYGHMQTENFGMMLELLIVFKKDTCELINDFKHYTKEQDYLFCEHWPIGRKHNAENSRAIFFMRKLYSFFTVEFGSPKYSTIETIVNVLFETAYTENHVIKYTTAMRKLECDDSLEK